MKCHRDHRRATVWTFLALVAALAGCEQPQPTHSIVAPTTSSATQVPSATVEPTRVRDIPKPIPTTAVPPTETLEPTPTLPPPPTHSSLSLKELNAYLAALFPNQHRFREVDYQTKLTAFESALYESIDLSGDGRLDQVAYDLDVYPDGIAFAIVYQDLNRDGVDDLVVFGFHGLLVLLWEDDHYSEPFVIDAGWSRGWGPYLRAFFEDWTGEGVPEIVLEEDSSGGGTGLWISTTTRSFVHCVRTCSVVWSDTVDYSVSEIRSGGTALYRAELTRRADAPDQFRVLTHGFSIYCCEEDGGPGPIEALNVYTSTLTTYAWNGARFEPGETATVSRWRIVESDSVLSSTNTWGNRADISWVFNGQYNEPNDVCWLSVNGGPLGKPFGCRHTFTQVHWQDLTGDGQDEIVVRAYSAGNPGGPLTPDTGPYAAYEPVGSVGCEHQRLMVYAWDGAQTTELADVAGCVQEEDLYGVRLEDIDGDGLLDLRAARVYASDLPDPLPERVYRWNGQRFVFWSELPSH